MADVLQEMTQYRIRQIEFAEAEYYEQLTKVLDKIEDDITSLAGKSLPLIDGKLIELRAAIALRPQIKAILEREYLAWSDNVVREGFNKQAKRVERAFKRIGKIPKEFAELTKGDLALIQNLKQQSFTQFKDISNTFTRKLADKVYQNTLLGVEFTVLEKELRQTINGIYASSKDPEIKRLVAYVKKNKKNKSKTVKLKVDKAVIKLQSKFGRDRVGDNMKRHAGTLLNDSLREFDATLNWNKANEAELTHVRYYGNVIPTTRDFCRTLISKNRIFTIDEAKKYWSQRRGWKGYKAGDPLIVRGGYNCRHQWSYVSPEWFNESGTFKH